ncbi:hypothetical protein [Nostoc sp.]
MQFLCHHPSLKTQFFFAIVWTDQKLGMTMLSDQGIEQFLVLA